jgi:hypothetical protein
VHPSRTPEHWRAANRDAARIVAIAGAALAQPAGAIVVDRGAVATTFIAVFAVFASILFLLVLGLVAVASRAPQRARHLRATAVWYPLAGIAALVALAVARSGNDDASFEKAVISCGVFLIATGGAFIATAFFASRRPGR